MAIAVALTLGTSAAHTEAATTIVTRTWVGDGGTDNWSNENNWNGNTDIPLDGSASIVFAASGARRLLSNVQNLVGLTVDGLTFNANQDYVEISGSLPITILGGGIKAFSPVKINAPLVVGASQTWLTTSYLTLSGGISFASGSGAYTLSIADSLLEPSGNITNSSPFRQTITSANTSGSSTGGGIALRSATWDGGTAGLIMDGGTAGLIIRSPLFNPIRDTTIILSRNVFVQNNPLPLELGNYGYDHSFDIRGGSTFESTGGRLGFNPQPDNSTFVGNGIVTVTGGGSAWYSSLGVVVGYTGPGSLKIADGGLVSTRGFSVVGSLSRGTVTVTGAGSLWSSAGDLVIGNGDSGTLDVTNGGKVTSNYGIIGRSSAGVGIVTLTGTGANGHEALWESAGPLTVGQEGRGTLNINGGGKVVAAGLSIGAQGVLNLSGGTLQLPSPTIALNATGQFNWSAGTLRVMNSFTLGSGILGDTWMLAAGRTLEAATSFDVGAGNQLQMAGGTLGGTGTLRNSGYLSGFGTIAGSGGFTNSALLTQSGSNLLLSNTGANANNGNWDLATGYQLQLAGVTLTNNAYLNLNGGRVDGGGTLVNAAGGVISGRGVISSSFSNAGVLALDAAATSIINPFNNSGQIQLASNAALLAGGTLTNTGRIEGFGKVSNPVRNRGMVEAVGGTLTFTGNFTNLSDGTVAVGSGAQLLIGAGLASNNGQIQLTGGTFDNNRFALTNDGTISGFGTWRSGSVTNNGRVLLSGGVSAINAPITANSGSQIILSGNSNTTFYGTVEVKSGAELRVSQGSVATFFGQVNQRNGALVTGTGAKNYEAGFAVGNSPGLGTDAGNVSFGSANVYEAEIGGNNPGGLDGTGIQFDRYVVGGTLTFGGTLKVVQYGGFAPQAGQSFDLFDWGTRQGQFSTIDFTAAPLASGLTWDTSHLYTDGTLTVAAVPEPGTYAMFAAGLGLMGFMVRRRRQGLAA